MRRATAEARSRRIRFLGTQLRLTGCRGLITRNLPPTDGALSNGNEDAHLVDPMFGVSELVGPVVAGVAILWGSRRRQRDHRVRGFPAWVSGNGRPLDTQRSR